MKKLKRILALLAVVFLVSLYVTTLIASFIDLPQQPNMLKACIYSTVVIPIFLWAYALVYRVLKNNRMQESFDETKEETISEDSIVSAQQNPTDETTK